MKRISTVITLVASAMLLFSCTLEKAVSILIIGSIDQTSTPFGDTLSNDGTIPSDTVDIVLFNELRNPDGVGGTANSDIILDSITVIYNRVDGGSDTPTPFRYAITLRIPAEGSARVEEFPILPATKKAEFPLSDLVFFGYERSTTFTSIKIDAILEFSGKTVDGEPIFAKGNLSIEITNWAD